jgi:hypothetical protein
VKEEREEQCARKPHERKPLGLLRRPRRSVRVASDPD